MFASRSAGSSPPQRAMAKAHSSRLARSVVKQAGGLEARAPGRDGETVTEEELAGNEPTQPLLLLKMTGRTEWWYRASANLYLKLFIT